jgi:hypothetical protein
LARTVGGVKAGNCGLPKGKLEVAPLGDFKACAAASRDVPCSGRHFSGRAKMKASAAPLFGMFLRSSVSVRMLCTMSYFCRSAGVA